MWGENCATLPNNSRPLLFPLAYHSETCLCPIPFFPPKHTPTVTTRAMRHLFRVCIVSFSYAHYTQTPFRFQFFTADAQDRQTATNKNARTRLLLEPISPKTQQICTTSHCLPTCGPSFRQRRHRVEGPQLGPNVPACRPSHTCIQ